MRKIVTLFLLSSFLTILPLKIHATPKIAIWPSYGGDFGIFNIEGGSGPSSTRKVWIKNEGTSSLTITNISSPSAPFSIVSPPAIPFTLTTGSEKDINIQFNPLSQGSYDDKVTISSNDPNEPDLEIPLIGIADEDPTTFFTLGVFVTGEIKVVGDTDVYYFYGKAGDMVYITTGVQKDYSGVYFSPRWKLYAPDGSLVKSDSDGGSGTAMLPSNGTYTILVGDGDPYSDDQAGRYGLSLQGVSASLTSCQNIVYGQNITDEIEAIGNTDAFCFYGSAGDTVSITTGVQKDYSGVYFSPRWEIYAPDGSLVKSDSDGGSGTAVLPSNGTYTILVGDGDPYFDAQAGRYGLSLQCIAGSCVNTGPPPCFGDFDGDGDVDGSDLAIFSASFGRADCPNK